MRRNPVFLFALKVLTWYMRDTSRRAFLLSSLTAATGCLAGCADDSPQDSDGDGVIDSEDYAPNDPDVQEKSDLQSNTEQPTATPTPTPTPTTTTTAPPVLVTDTPTQTERTVSSRTLAANYDPLVGQTSYFETYGLTESTVTINPDTLDETYPDGAKLTVLTTSHPSRETVYGYGTSDPFTITEDANPFTVTVTADDTRVPDEPVYNIAVLIPGNEQFEDVTATQMEYLTETNRYRIQGDHPVADPHPLSLDATETSTFERTVGEGTYGLQFYGTTNGYDWDANYLIYKSSYIERVSEPRGRQRREYVAVAQQQGIADAMGQIIETEAERNGFTEKQEKVAFLIDFVQNLPYVPDDVSTGYDDYTKFMTETMAEAEGDCEDTSVVLAALLQSEPFNYDAVLLLLPGHMAVGVYGTDLPGYYYQYNGRRYYYLETTGDGWGVGDIPETYRGEEARIYDV